VLAKSGAGRGGLSGYEHGMRLFAPESGCSTWRGPEAAAFFAGTLNEFMMWSR